MSNVILGDDEARIALLKIQINDLSKKIENPDMEIKQLEQIKLRLAYKIILLERLQNLAAKKMQPFRLVK